MQTGHPNSVIPCHQPTDDSPLSVPVKITESIFMANDIIAHVRPHRSIDRRIWSG